MKIFTIVRLDKTKVKLDGIIGTLYTGTEAPAKMYREVMLIKRMYWSIVNCLYRSGMSGMSGM